MAGVGSTLCGNPASSLLCVGLELPVRQTRSGFLSLWMSDTTGESLDRRPQGLSPGTLGCGGGGMGEQSRPCHTGGRASSTPVQLQLGTFLPGQLRLV